ncbi:choline/carnitine O-acyltransferase [Cardiobacteriaceae bacterium TAE3-ERU3]|nr:choline/carnitine O-acyltransferase [Cardiobacteriaceae bacterium TAE3-ERU3]
MSQLPVPPLESTLKRFVDWLSPIVDDKTLQNSQKAAEAFHAGEGQDLQARLERFAADKAPDSWLIETWREANLANRDSLPLSTNVAMRIEWSATQTGLKRVAHFVNALVQVHADYRNGKPIDTHEQRGQALCREQQKILLGASRRPNQGIDKFVFNEDTTGIGYIVVLCKGYAWRVNVLDEKGGIASPAQLDHVIHIILNAHEQEAEIAFTAPSILPAEHACEIRAQLICRGDNSNAWQCIEGALFVLSLDETHHQDGDAALTETLFNDGSDIWAYKPLNYVCYLNDDRYYVHFEHTWTDAGTIADIIACAQAHYDEQDCSRKNQLPADLGMTALEWRIGEQTRLLLKEHLAEYVRRAETLRIRHSEIIISEADQQLLAGYSKDALCQILLQYAQYATFGKIHNTYEAVDMRHFANGRTECLRPVSRESVALIKALYDGVATKRQFDDFVAEHKNRIKACKRGEGVHRHLLGLATQAKEAEVDAAIFKDAGYRQLGEDVFSTTSLGTHDHIGHIAFAPTCKDGYGINYTALRNHYSFVVIYRRSKGEQVESLIEELESGIRRILMLLRQS